MKKLILLSAMALSVLSLNAQTKETKTGVSLGVKAGATFSKLSTITSDATVSSNAITSFYVGGIVDIPVTSMFSIQPGISFIGKGGKSSVSKANPMYIEIPVNIVGKVEAGPGKVFAGVGPYVAMGIAGKAGDNTIKFGDGKDFQTIDFGLNFMLGYQLTNGLSINGGYGLGLIDIAGTETSGESTKNSVFSVGLGFNF